MICSAPNTARHCVTVCCSLVTADYYNAPMLYTNPAPYPNVAAPAQNPYQGEDTYQRESAVDSEPRPN